MRLAKDTRHILAGNLAICRLLNGMWQVSGGHGPIDPERTVAAMAGYHDAGFTTWDLADHYGPAEDLLGAFRRELAAARGGGALAGVQAFTKWVPSPGSMTRSIVEEAIDRSRSRMAADRLDLLQFHWWDYGDRRYFDALQHLADLTAVGKIRHLGLTNFDTERLALILDRGIPVVSNQVQYSLVDQRPATRMAALCQERGVALLTYGTLLGGFLSEDWLGRAEPGRAELATVSLRKYKNMIDAWGSWPLFQELLAALRAVGRRHGAGIANIGTRMILDSPAVAGVILGTRLGIAEHIADNARVFGLALEEEDAARLGPVLASARDLMHVIGDCGDEYR